MCLEIYKLGPTHFLTAPGLAWQTALKEIKVKLDLLTDIDMLLMVEKGVRGKICHSIYRYAKANNKYMKHYDESKESPYFNTAQKMRFSIKDFFSKCDQICRKLRIWSHLLKKPLVENFIFCTA